jgi:hypothetical protein
MSRRAGPNKISYRALVFLAAIFTTVGVGASDPRRASAQPAPLPAETAPPAATPTGCLPATTTQYESSQIVYQQFPSKGPAETAWIVQWFENGHKGLWIQGAWFWRKKPFTAATLIQVLGQSGLSDIFVPYHDPIPAMPNNGRLHDLGSGYLHAAIPQDAGDCGAIADPAIPWPGSSPAGAPPTRRVLIKEIRDRGVA